MSNQIEYKGREKTFLVPKKKRKLKKEAKIIGSLVSFVLFIVFSALLFVNSYNFGNNSNIVDYAEKGNAGYKVYLKDNSDFDTPFLEEGMGYIASLISSINVDFDYRINSEYNFNLDYGYSITADLYITDALDGKILKTESYDILTKDHISVQDNNLLIFEDVDIDYDYYNNYVNAFKAEHGIAIDSKLVVSLKVNTTAESDLLSEGISIPANLTLEIPLSEQTIEIKFVSNNIDNNEYVSNVGPEGIDNMPLFIVSVFLTLCGLWSLFVALTTIVSLYVKNDIYQYTIKKYLREYDRIIVTSKQPDLSEDSFTNKIRVMSIEELIDAHDATGNPIIYYEVINNEKSYFIIINNNTLYKLTISRAYLENQNK